MNPRYLMAAMLLGCAVLFLNYEVLTRMANALDWIGRAKCH